jgi:Histone deacetylase domain
MRHSYCTRAVAALTLTFAANTCVDHTGFCLLNNVAVAAAVARAQGVERVLIVDWDVSACRLTHLHYNLIQCRLACALATTLNVSLQCTSVPMIVTLDNSR